MWEYGFGVGAVAYEDYRGSTTVHGYPLPVPYVVYNGRFLKANRDGVRATLFNQEWLELNFSGNGTTPVHDNSARFGMPNLKATLEVGPSLDVHLFRSQDGKVKFDLNTPFRAAFALDSPVQSIGWTFTPRFNLDLADPLGHIGWNVGVLFGPLFAARRYDAFFYTVAPQYATAGRPAYQAEGGYAGTQAIVALSRRFDKMWVGGFMRYDTLAGASFADSPLVETKHYWSAGLAVSWTLGRSKRTVEIPR